MARNILYSWNTIMNAPKKRAFKGFIIHLSIWILYFLYENGAVFLIYPDSVFPLSSGFYFLLNAVIFYSSFYIVRAIGKNRFRYLKRVGTIVGLSVLYLALNYQVMILIHLTQLSTTMYTTSIRQFVILRLFRYLYIISLSYTYWLVTDKLHVERNLMAMEKIRLTQLQKTAELEKEKIKSELNYLRLQINPHFLFNTLSFIYTEVILYSEKASEGIMLLSNILRNVLADPDGEGKIPLRDEIGHMNDLIKIHQLRYEQKLAISMTVQEALSLSAKKIIPFILVTFLENAFKHGDSTDIENAMIVDLSAKEDDLYFFLRNKKKHTQSLNRNFGIGIANIEKRLKLAYPDRHLLEIRNEDSTYSINLKISLADD